MAHSRSADPTKYVNTVLYAYERTSTSRSTKSHMGLNFSPTDTMYQETIPMSISTRTLHPYRSKIPAGSIHGEKGSFL
jgi:hypothetical protein